MLVWEVSGSGGDDGAGGRDAGAVLVIGGELEEHVPLGLVLDGAEGVGEERSGEGEVDGVALAHGDGCGEASLGSTVGFLDDEGAVGAGDLGYARMAVKPRAEAISCPLRRVPPAVRARACPGTSGRRRRPGAGGRG